MIDRLMNAALWVLTVSLCALLLFMGVAFGAHPILLIPYLAFVVFVVALGMEASHD